MVPINTKQHSKILGSALIAYGWHLLLPALLLLTNTEFYSELFRVYQYNGIKLFFDQSFYREHTDIFYLLIIFVSGISILISKGKFRFFSLSFVFLFLTAFPLGTFLSFYVLWYLFVLSEEKSNIKPELVRESQ